MFNDKCALGLVVRFVLWVSERIELPARAPRRMRRVEAAMCVRLPLDSGNHGQLVLATQPLLQPAHLHRISRLEEFAAPFAALPERIASSQIWGCRMNPVAEDARSEAILDPIRRAPDYRIYSMHRRPVTQNYLGDTNYRRRIKLLTGELA